jgi:hypothetical protein
MTMTSSTEWATSLSWWLETNTVPQRRSPSLAWIRLTAWRRSVAGLVQQRLQRRVLQRCLGVGVVEHLLERGESSSSGSGC